MKPSFKKRKTIGVLRTGCDKGCSETWYLKGGTQLKLMTVPIGNVIPRKGEHLIFQN
jgi:hypothetical protein